MPGFLPSLNDHVRRLARREIRAGTARTQRASAKHRKDIAALKRLIRDLAARLSVCEKRSSGQGPVVTATASDDASLRFRRDGLRTHRAKLGLSAKDYAALLGVSALTVYHWETGHSKPRRRHLPAIAAVRALGKREALARLHKK